MKIKFKKINQEELKRIKETLDEVINMNFEEMELTEENLKKAKEMKDKVNSLHSCQFLFGGTEIIIVSPDGIELTKMC